MQDIKDILKEYWGFDNFRPLQAEIITSLLSGKDTLAVLPTGGGKSICFQVPAMMQDGICLVISPLIALMRDQVSNLKKRGIQALTLHSGLSYIEVKKILQNASFGNYKFLYVSPERLESALFLEYLPAIPVSMIAVDEAHCVSQWGYDFRPPYLRIASIRAYFPEVPIIALTASATREVRKDIVEKLAFRKIHECFQQSFARPNLSYSIFNPLSKENKILEILKNVPGCGIIYCRSRRKTKELSDFLTMNGISGGYYHAGLENKVRESTQQDWVNNKVRVICCTNAFGMGIDKPDVRSVIHYDVPDCLENYYQEAGRAGRDGKRAYAILLFRASELSDLSNHIDVRFPVKEKVKEVYQALVNYLQLPSDSGESLYFDFDLPDFSSKFKIDLNLATYCLKILQQEDIIAYSDNVFSPPKVVFTTSREQLELFEKEYPQFENVIKSLLRTYNGIFDFPAAINEKALSKSLGIKENELTQSLKELQKRMILEYQPYSLKPQIQFLKNRVLTRDLYLNELAIKARKNAYAERVKGIVNYVSDKTTCRSKLIGNYFGDTTIEKCTICDNCINQQQLPAPDNLLDIILKAISDSENAITVENLLLTLPYNKEDVWIIIDFLLAEQRIQINIKGGIVAKKKGPR